MTTADWIKLLVPIFVMLAGALAAAIANNQRKIGRLEWQMELLWGAAEAHAAGALHHQGQPEMDRMIEAYMRNDLSIDAHRQFIERLKVIASGASNAPEQVPQARMLLVGAERKYKTRLAHPQALELVRKNLQDEDDRQVAERTAAESTVTPNWDPEAKRARQQAERAEKAQQAQPAQHPAAPPGMETIEVTGIVVTPKDPSGPADGGNEV